MFQVRKNGKRGVRLIENYNSEDNKIFLNKEIDISTNKRYIKLGSGYCILLCPFICFFIPLTFVLFMFSTIIVACLGTIIFIIIMFITFSFLYQDLIFIKDESNNKLNMKIINSLNREKLNITMNLNNIHFDCHSIEDIGEYGGYYFFNRLFIINNLINENEIDLDISNIQTIPKKFFYIFNNVTSEIYKDYIELKNGLNNFINADLDYKNPLFFDIDKYMNKKTNSTNFYNDHTKYNIKEGNLSSYMKISEYFFTFWLEKPKTRRSHFPLTYIFLNYFILVIVIPIIGIFLRDKIFFLYPACVILAFTILNLIPFLLNKLYNKKIMRIDCVFSKNYDRIFIGLVRRNENSYKNTFLFQINNIIKFELQQYNNSSKSFYLKVLLKENNISQEIMFIKGKKYNELEGLIYLLNEKINSKENI